MGGAASLCEAKGGRPEGKLVKLVGHEFAVSLAHSGTSEAHDPAWWAEQCPGGGAGVWGELHSGDCGERGQDLPPYPPAPGLEFQSWLEHRANSTHAQGSNSRLLRVDEFGSQ